MSDYPTLLRRPSLDRLFTRVEDILSGQPSDYLVEQRSDLWTVRRHATGEWIYQGPGPVEVARSPAPF